MHYDFQGRRKYLNERERRAFIVAARNAAPKVDTLCLTLAFTGARISEVLALTLSSIDYEEGLISINTLKQRKKGANRQILLPPWLLVRLGVAHEEVAPGEPLWAFGRTTAWARVKEVMHVAGIAGPRDTPRALRHTFCVHGLHAVKIPLPTMKEWMGHTQIKTTERYAVIVGDEARALGRRMW